jgi:hypothetical protein
MPPAFGGYGAPNRQRCCAAVARRYNPHTGRCAVCAYPGCEPSDSQTMLQAPRTERRAKTQWCLCLLLARADLRMCSDSSDPVSWSFKL